ncbi:MAG: DGQHR domain-containing protein [Trichodesmium sp. MO_231.B1]|nr:DGQHR domain-containing protein [Trichodesmium sp. MO_231.B1]
MIPEDKVCLIGEITSRTDTGKINTKYKKFINQINIIKKLEFSDDIWQNLGIKQQSIRKFRNIQSIKGFFITTTKERFDLNLPKVEDVVVFYKSDFLRLSEYSQNIRRWTRNYFLDKFSLVHRTHNSISIYEKDHELIRSTNKQISKKYEDNDAPLSDLYTFTISPYEILDIVHVYRQDELPSLQDSSTYNYQRPLNPDKLKEIRKNLLTDCDFIFPSNILVILSKECKYMKDGDGNSCLYIPKKYGSISVIDGQHRLFSYADEKVKLIMQDDCKIMVTAVSFRTEVQEIITKFSARVFIEINLNQTKVEMAHIDKIAYELGSNDPKVIATKIIVTLNTRQNFRGFFDIASDKTNKGIIEAGIIIDAIKKITNIRKIKELAKARVNTTKLRKDGYEKLFDSTIE